MKNVLKKWIEYQTIKRSGLFDPTYYLLHNPDVKDANPLSHFIEYGWKEGRNPSQAFDTRFYLATNPDVQKAGGNPLLHYLRFGQTEGRAKNPIEHESKIVMGMEVHPDLSKRDLAEILDLLDPEPHIPFVSPEAPIDILIPVYNTADFLEALLASILRNTSIPYRLLIASDKSPDLRMSEYLAEVKNKNPDVDILLVENEDNPGFARMVNKLAALSQNHFVILNTYVEVPPYWLERLMHPILTNDQIASTTPFSNAGVINSFPNFLEDNPLFEGMDVATLDSFFHYVNIEKNYLEIPTGVQFCMGINKNVWNTVGKFDERLGKDYGEENHWCMRAVKAGYKNIIVPNLFIYHKRSESFSSEDKKKLEVMNSRLLRERDPEYVARVADFIQRDPLKDLRTLLKIKILSYAKSPKIILDHALGGGANAYSNLLAAKENLSIVIMPDGEIPRNYIVQFHGQNIEETSLPMGNIRDIGRIRKHFNVHEIIFNELIGYPKPKILELVDYLIDLKKEHPHTDFSFMTHDFFSVCPIYNLLDYDIKYCGVPTDLGYCDKCLKHSPLMGLVIPFVQHDYPDLRMTLWREKFGTLLACCSRIVCFSQSSKEILQKAYPNLAEDKFKIMPHATDWVRTVTINKTSEELHIAVIGHLNIHKGIRVVSSLASYIDYYGLNVKIHVFGDVLDPNESFGFLKAVVKHGRFTRTDLPRLMEENEIDLVLIPSIWPETFSFTTQEAISMQLPLAVFDLGAPAERVRHYDKGIVLQQQDPAYILGKIYEYFNRKLVLNSKIRKDLTFVCVSNNELVYNRGVLSSAFMTEHPIIKYDNRETNLPIPSRYNDAINTLLDSNYNGWVFFVHNDFSLLEPIDPIVDSLDPHRLYGPIGAVLVNGEKKLVGQILQGHNGGLIYHGTPVDQPTLVDTVDCQALLVHTNLLRAHPLRFDEHEPLFFHQYVEEFCIQANVNYTIQTYAVPIQCKHASWGTLNRQFQLAIDYIHSKYPNKQWAGTSTHLWQL